MKSNYYLGKVNIMYGSLCYSSSTDELKTFKPLEKKTHRFGRHFCYIEKINLPYVRDNWYCAIQLYLSPVLSTNKYQRGIPDLDVRSPYEVVGVSCVDWKNSFRGRRF